MSKYTVSSEGIPQELLPFEAKTTQVAIRGVQEVKYLPINSFDTSDTVNFEIPPQQNLMIKNIEIVTKFSIENDDDDVTALLVSNPANSLWKQVDIILNNKHQLSNPMQQSSNYETFFSTILNVDQEREDVLLNNQRFLLDDGGKEDGSDDRIISPARIRSTPITSKRSVTVISDLNCSLLKTSKLLIPGLEFNISLTKNKPEFLLLSLGTHTIKIEKVYLSVTFVQAEEAYLAVLEKRLETTPAIYDGHRTEISTFGIQSGVTEYQFNNIYRGHLPHFMVVCVQDREAINGHYAKNPFTFYPFKSIQVYINNREYFADPLEASEEDDTLVINHFYKALGYDLKGTCLINRKNFRAHFMIPIALARDRTIKHHHNLQEVADFKVEIKFEQAVPANQVLMVYSVFDQLIKIDKQRNVEILWTPTKSHMSCTYALTFVGCGPAVQLINLRRKSAVA